MARLPGNVTVVIPAMNEERRLPVSLAAIEEFRAAHPGVITETIVVDDGSSDATAAAAGSFPFTTVLTNGRNRGKGYSIRRGVEASRGDLVLLTDADLSTPIGELETLAAALEGADIAIGSRALPGSEISPRQPWYRQTMGKTFNLVMRAVTGIPFRDTQCGFKLLRGDAARRIFARAEVERFAFDVEMLVIASRLGFSTVEVPVRWANSSDSRVHVIRDSSRMLVDTVKVRWRLGRYRR